MPTRIDPGVQEKYLLFTTKTCPNCRMAKIMLDKANVPYENIDANENAEMTKEMGVMSAPTLAVVRGNDVRLIQNASNIKAFAEEYTSVKA